METGARERLPTRGILVGSPMWWPDGEHVSYFELMRDGRGRADAAARARDDDGHVLVLLS